MRDSDPNFPLAGPLGAAADAQRRKCRYVLVLAGLPKMRSYLKKAKRIPTTQRFSSSSSSPRKPFIAELRGVLESKPSNESILIEAHRLLQFAKVKEWVPY
jgi:hypothetical protein